PSSFFFFPTPPSPSVIYTLSLHDALPIFVFEHDVALFDARLGGRALRDQAGYFHSALFFQVQRLRAIGRDFRRADSQIAAAPLRSEEHTSELQSRGHLVCRLLLEKKKKE